MKRPGGRRAVKLSVGLALVALMPLQSTNAQQGLEGRGSEVIRGQILKPGKGNEVTFEEVSLQHRADGSRSAYLRFKLRAGQELDFTYELDPVKGEYRIKRVDMTETGG